MAKKKKKILSTDEKFANAERILAAKELRDNALDLFEKALKKTIPTKQRGSK